VIWKARQAVRKYIILKPTSNMSLCDLIQCIVKSRLTVHLCTDNLLNPHQSAYCKHHSTETAFLYTHNYLIDATDSQRYHVSVFLYTRVPLSPSSTIWYRLRGWSLSLGK